MVNLCCLGNRTTRSITQLERDSMRNATTAGEAELLRHIARYFRAMGSRVQGAGPRTPEPAGIVATRRAVAVALRGAQARGAVVEAATA